MYKFLVFFSFIKINSDVVEPWGIFFQDNASPQMEGLEELHNNIMFYLAIILFAVSWMMVSIVIYFKNKKISNKYVTHGTLVELIWTISPPKPYAFVSLPLQCLFSLASLWQMEAGQMWVCNAYQTLCDCYGFSMKHCGVNIHDTTNGWNVLIKEVVEYYPAIFTQGENTILTEEVFNKLAREINRNPRYHELGLKLDAQFAPPQNRLNVAPPTLEHFNTVRKNSVILAKIEELSRKVTV